MQTYVLQDWVTIGTDTNVGGLTNIVQPAAGWLDLGEASDALFFLEVAQVSASGTPKLYFETAPLRSASLFKVCVTRNLAAGTSPVTDKVTLYNNPSVPLARWVRWRGFKDAGSGIWTATIRAVVVAYPK